MRKILFRGKWTRNGKWIEGFYARIHDGKGNVSHRIYPGYAESDCGYFYPEWFEVDPSTIGQYTGLCDKNGKEIFEGDVLKIARKFDLVGSYYNPPIVYPVNAIVKWDMCAWMWETIREDKYYISFPEAWCHFECEVIGNIHDNPELLEGEES